MDGFVGGVQIGKNWQNGRIVYGWEADATFSDMGLDVGSLSVDIDWMATARGRVGYLFQPNLLGYATAGLGIVAWSVDFGVPGFGDDGTETGFVFGLGAEYKYNATTSVRAEYLDVDGIDVIRAGLNFKLNGYGY